MGSALHKAVQGRHIGIFNILLENRASVNDKDTRGSAPLRIAAEVGDADIVQSLLRKGADKETSGVKGYTALYAAALFRHLAATQALLAAGADVGYRCGEFEKGALHEAAKNGHVDIVGLLLEYGADMDACDREGSTALHYSSLNDTVGIVDALVKAGANVNAQNQYGGTPLHYDAADEVNQGAVLALLKHSAEVNARTNNENTPLHYAAGNAGKQGSPQTVDLLLRWGADEKAKSYYGHAPADIVGKDIDEQDRLAEDVEHVRKLLTNAPADRAWRRRGYLTMCRAHPNRRQPREINQPDASMTPRTRSRAKLVTAGITSTSGGGGGEISVDERSYRGSWAAVLAGLLGVEEEGLFWTIVGYL